MDTPKIKAIIAAAVKNSECEGYVWQELANTLVAAGFMVQHEHREGSGIGYHYESIGDLDARITELCAPPAESADDDAAEPYLMAPVADPNVTDVLLQLTQRINICTPATGKATYGRWRDTLQALALENTKLKVQLATKPSPAVDDLTLRATLDDLALPAVKHALGLVHGLLTARTRGSARTCDMPVEWERIPEKIQRPVLESLAYSVQTDHARDGLRDVTPTQLEAISLFLGRCADGVRPWGAAEDLLRELGVLDIEPQPVATSVEIVPAAKRIPISELVANMVEPDEDVSDTAPRLPRLSEVLERVTKRVTLEAVEQPDGSLRVADTATNRAKLDAQIEAIRTQQASVYRGKLWTERELMHAGAIASAPGAADDLAELLGEKLVQSNAGPETEQPTIEAMEQARLSLRSLAKIQRFHETVAERADCKANAPVVDAAALHPSMTALMARLGVALDAQGNNPRSPAPCLDAQDRGQRMALGFGTIDRLVEAAERGEISWSSERGWFRP